MTDNRTTELLRELRDLAADVNPSEIVDHVKITSMGWTFNAQWLDSWHAEFDRITDKLEQAMAATLGSGECKLDPLSALEMTLNMLSQTEWGACSECGCAVPMEARFCNECGRKVVKQ